MQSSSSLSCSPEGSEDQPRLNPQEREAVLLIVSGLKDAEISQRLEVSPSEVRQLIKSLYAKLGVSDRLDLIIHAIHFGIASPPH